MSKISITESGVVFVSPDVYEHLKNSTTGVIVEAVGESPILVSVYPIPWREVEISFWEELQLMLQDATDAQAEEAIKILQEKLAKTRK